MDLLELTCIRAKRLKKEGKLEWLTHVHPENTPAGDVPWEDLADTTFVKGKNVLLAMLKNSMMLTVGQDSR